MYEWTNEKEKEFIKAKRFLMKDQILHPFDLNLPAKLLTNRSRLFSMGFVLLQQRDRKWHIVKCSSATLMDAQRKYAVCEIEMLGIVLAVKKCAFYLSGMKHFEIVTYHRPLLGVFQKDLPEVENRRLHQLREKINHYNFKVSYNEGKKHLVAGIRKKGTF